MMKTRFPVALAMSALLSPLAFADWHIGPGSQVQFVSIKNNTVGEVSHFETLSGSVTDAGDVEVGWCWTRLRPTLASATSA